MPGTVRPLEGEYAPYYGRYVSLVPDGPLPDLLEAGARATRALLGGLPTGAAGFAYAEGKWTILQVLAHVVETERVFAYRLLSVARGDPAALPGFDQDLWMANTSLDGVTLAALLNEFMAMRSGTVALLRRLTEADLARWGLASGHPVTARALAFMIAGHELHHQAILRREYLPRLAGGGGE